MFKAIILTPNRVLYEGEVWSVFLPGATGEFEILDFHKPIVSLLKEGNIIINWEKEIPIKKGAVRVDDNELVAVVED